MEHHATLSAGIAGRYAPARWSFRYTSIALSAIADVRLGLYEDRGTRPVHLGESGLAAGSLWLLDPRGQQAEIVGQRAVGELRHTRA